MNTSGRRTACRSSAAGIPSQCEICEATFPSRTRLFAHLRADHEEEHEYLSDEHHAAAAVSGGLDVTQRQKASNAARLALRCPDLEAYYAIQSSRGSTGIMSPSQLSAALSTYRTSLPLAFRINTNSFPRDSVQQLLIDALFDSAPPNAIKSVPSVPNVYVAAIPIRYWSERSRKILGDAQELGACHRQEVVSALPALLLNIQPHHCVLDLCAAPGSKTLQMLDLMHKRQQGCNNIYSDNDGTRSTDLMNRKDRNSKTSTGGDADDEMLINYPSGILVANDPARNRLLQLTRRSRRQARTPLITSASDGRYFPTLRKVLGYKLKFDCVLCDVPCSGDGTLRKLSGGDWRKWSSREAITLHKLQVRLLVRALKAVKRGGKVLYSTCSLNPIENEAVVCEAVRQCTNDTDAYQILPLPDVLDGAKEKWNRCPGAVNWVVPDSKFRADNPIVYESYDDVPSRNRKGKGVPMPSMFPPKTRRCKGAGICSCQDSSKRGVPGDCLTGELTGELEATLAHAARILPQHCDSGGFFCCLVERLQATFYAVCLDPETHDQMQDIKSIHHGKIYHPVHSARQIRDMIRASPVGTRNSDTPARPRLRHIFEGVASLSAAVSWLRKHGAYVVGVSDSFCALPPIEPVPTATTNIEEDGVDTKSKPSGTSSERSTPMYSPLFQKPHPSLLAEFFSFYGLRPESFPNIVVVGGRGADKVTSYVEVPAAAEREACQAGRHDIVKKDRRLKYLQLSLVSPTTRRINSGGAKFTPIESGLGLCYVPLIKIDETEGIESTAFRADEKDNRRSVGRYALLDEAAEVVGEHATKRVVVLSRYQILKLLHSSFIRVDDVDDHEEEGSGNETVKEGWSHLEDATTWKQNGGVICLHLGKSNNDGDTKKMFLSCLLCVEGEVRGLKLLSDYRLAESYRRVFEI